MAVICESLKRPPCKVRLSPQHTFCAASSSGFVQRPTQAGSTSLRTVDTENTCRQLFRPGMNLQQKISIVRTKESRGQSANGIYSTSSRDHLSSSEVKLLGDAIVAACRTWPLCNTRQTVELYYRNKSCEMAFFIDWDNVWSPLSFRLIFACEVLKLLESMP